jgi:hypothetical protein
VRMGEMDTYSPRGARHIQCPLLPDAMNTVICLAVADVAVGGSLIT